MILRNESYSRKSLPLLHTLPSSGVLGGTIPVLLILISGILFPSPCFGSVLDDLTQWEEGRSMCASSAQKGKDGLPDPTANSDNVHRIEPGQTATIADLSGPGVITHIWITVFHFQTARPGWAPDGRANPQELLLRMYWDNRAKPDVEAPLSDFFGSCFGKRITVRSMPVAVDDGDSYNCYWRMPFRISARIEVVNQSAKPAMLLYYSIDWIKKESLPPDTMYFCAQYRQEYPVQGNPHQPDNEYLILDAEGKGYYVGTVLAVRTRSPDWFGEGDLRVTIDGEATPSIWGTGTEDYFLSAWGQKETLMPYFGNPYLNHSKRDVGQMSCCYRWHVHDPIVFSKSLRVAIETMGWLNIDENTEGKSRHYGQRQDDWSSIAFWYQDGPTKKFAASTTAQQRKLPRLERVAVWGKDHADEKYHGPGHTQLYAKDEYMETEGLLRFTPNTREDGWMEFPFEIKQKEPLRLILVLERCKYAGIYQPLLNGVKLNRPIDLYLDTSEIHEFQIMDFWPDPGKYTLRLECVGRNPSATGYRLGVNSVRLRERRPRVKQIGYLKDHDWRSDPILIDRHTKPRQK